MPSGMRRVFSTEAIWRIFSESATKMSFVESVKIFFPEKSRRIERTAFLSKTGSGFKTTSILSGFKKNTGVAKRTKKSTAIIPQRKSQPTVRR
jgi:hypothetical protein